MRGGGSGYPRTDERRYRLMENNSLREKQETAGSMRSNGRECQVLHIEKNGPSESYGNRNRIDIEDDPRRLPSGERATRLSPTEGRVATRG